MLRRILYRGRSAATLHFPLQFQNLIITKIHTKALRFNAPPLSSRKYKDYYNYPDMLDSKIIVDYNMVTMKLEVRYMLAIPELAMPRSRKVTTVCNGRREVWTDYEQAKAYFLEIMMTAEGEERERAECIYIQLLHGLDDCSDEDE